MAESNYTHGDMNVDAQRSMYSTFMRAGAWGSVILLVAVAYMTFTLSIGLNWLVALILSAGAGIAIGLFMGFGGAWIATIIALAGLALFIQLLIALFSIAL
ncbi:MAG: aa3-type cytochrome c oxidase subunit IV [Henriciella sp.]|uniref:aa3-type cytochrome c oxidase subunit IV n=1 Tax=Henriciella sp. TaxID=1968823 RepID=UPI003C70AECE